MKSIVAVVALVVGACAWAEAAPTLKTYRLEGTPKAFYYSAVQPLEKGSPCEIAVVLVHGWGDGTAAPIEQAPMLKALAKATPEGKCVPYVLAPFFPRREIMERKGVPEDGRAVWNDSWGRDLTIPGSPDDDWRGGGDAVGTTFSSFDAIDCIFAALGDRKLYPNLRRVVLTGFSAGGQFVGRYVAVGKGKVRDGVTVEYAAMAPSTELRLDRDIRWHYGLKDRPRYSAALSYDEIYRNLSTRHVRRACGTKDDLCGSGNTVDSCPAAMAQGRSRIERFRSLEQYLKKYPEWARQVTFHPIEGLGHDTCTAHSLPEFVDYVFGRDGAR